jgi:hypothetical protein
MAEFQRYALYLVPDGALGAFGAAWLAWDTARGIALAAPDGAPGGWAEKTLSARNYGFHATIKPPFRLAEGTDAPGLMDATATLCARLRPFDCDGLVLANLDRFLALVPTGPTGPLDGFAAEVVADLDPFRRPALPQETARRRAAGLTPRQEDYLNRWGYPYVMEEFQAHFTLTDRLDAGALPIFTAHLQDRLAAVPLRPFRVDSLCLVGELATGGFALIHRYALTG